MSKCLESHSSNLQPLHRIWLRLMIVVGGLGLLCATLFPFAPDWPKSLAELSAEADRRIDWGVFSHGGIKDCLGNVLLFVPLGFGLAGILLARGSRPIRAVVVTCATAALLSAGAETAQLVLPSRGPALGDLVANTAGGFVGAIMLWLIGTRLLERLTWVFAAPAAGALSARRLDIAFTAYAAVVLAGSLFAARHRPFDAWDPDMPLVIGNEHTGRSAWRGVVLDPLIADRVMSPDEIHRAVQQRRAGMATAEGIAIHDVGHHPTRVVDAGRNITRRIIASSGFTISAILSSDKPSQHGPARIISISGGQWERNLTLAQQDTHLIIRVETPLTRSRGELTQFILAHVFAEQAAHRVSVTFDGCRLRTYVDHCPMGTVDLSPELLLVWRLLPFRPMSVVLGRTDARMWRLGYDTVVFAPLGLLAGLLASTVTLPLRARAAWALAMVLAPPVVLHLAIAGVQHRAIDWTSAASGAAAAVIASIIAMLCGFVATPRNGNSV